MKRLITLFVGLFLGAVGAGLGASGVELTRNAVDELVERGVDLSSRARRGQPQDDSFQVGRQRLPLAGGWSLGTGDWKLGTGNWGLGT